MNSPATTDTTAPTLTSRQHAILQQTIGLHVDPESVRNFYITHEDADDYPDCQRLVALGLMTRHSTPHIAGFIYLATEAGREQARRCA